MLAYVEDAQQCVLVWKRNQKHCTDTAPFLCSERRLKLMKAPPTS
jgi:hypothetical protein